MAAQHSKEEDYSTRYRFNGKEQDESTDFYYYGAHYYEPILSRWLSTDPLAEKYQGFSPYNYTLNNPIMLVDPDGMQVDWHKNKDGNLVVDKGDSAYTLSKQTVIDQKTFMSTNFTPVTAGASITYTNGDGLGFTLSYGAGYGLSGSTGSSSSLNFNLFWKKMEKKHLLLIFLG